MLSKFEFRRRGHGNPVKTPCFLGGQEQGSEKGDHGDHGEIWGLLQELGAQGRMKVGMYLGHGTYLAGPLPPL